MAATHGIPEFADSYLVEVLDEFGLAVKYVRAGGQKLYYDDGQGNEVEVLDLACGFGSLMFGHNNSEIVEHVKWLLDQGTPVHAQLTGYSYGPPVAEAVNRLIRREQPDAGKYFGLFANSGAESVEVSIKHAELGRGARIAALTEQLEANLAVARSAVAGGASVTEQAYASVELPPDVDPSAGLERIAEAVARRNAKTQRRSPLFLSLEGGFHGKLVSSVQLTYNPEFRLPFSALSAQARFIPLDRPDFIETVVQQERAVVLDFEVRDGAVHLVERDYPIFVGFYLEPVLGEAGIKVVSAELAKAARDVCDRFGFPLVADEIQSGMGRTGTFLASTWTGVRPDYIILAKSLGGGIVKTGMVLIHESVYHKEFELMHTTTFGKDGLSCRVALKVLEMLEANDGHALTLAREQGERARSMMAAVRDDYPDVVKEIRGQGLMFGFEFRDQSESASAAIRDWAEHETLAYVIWGHLLRKHQIRILSTASNLNTLRFEPSVYLTEAELRQFESALRDVCQILRDADESRFVIA